MRPAVGESHVHARDPDAHRRLGMLEQRPEPGWAQPRPQATCPYLDQRPQEDLEISRVRRTRRGGPAAVPATIPVALPGRLVLPLVPAVIPGLEHPVVATGLVGT